MLTIRHDAFPFEAVRDLIGILRALYAAERGARARPLRVAAIARVGRELRVAVDLALDHATGTLGHAAAWDRAERAAAALGDLVDCTTPLSPTLAAAARRVCEDTRPSGAREQERLARRQRG